MEAPKPKPVTSDDVAKLIEATQQAAEAAHAWAWPLALALIVGLVGWFALTWWSTSKGFRERHDLQQRWFTLAMMGIGALLVGYGVYKTQDILMLATAKLPLDQNEREAISGFLHAVALAIQMPLIAAYLIMLSRAMQPEPVDSGKLVMEANRRSLETIEKALDTIERNRIADKEYLSARDRELFKLMTFNHRE